MLNLDEIKARCEAGSTVGIKCVYETTDGYCERHSDGVEYREPCLQGPCDDFDGGKAGAK